MSNDLKRLAQLAGIITEGMSDPALQQIEKMVNTLLSAMESAEGSGASQYRGETGGGHTDSYMSSAYDPEFGKAYDDAVRALRELSQHFTQFGGD